MEKDNRFKAGNNNCPRDKEVKLVKLCKVGVRETVQWISQFNNLNILQLKLMMKQEKHLEPALT